jgi:hypothetical protein
MKMRLVVFGLLLAGVAGCNALKHQSGGVDQNAPTTLVVDNRGFIDMTVYAIRNSQRLRLGIAPGNHKTTLVIPPALLGGITTLRFVADPIGGSRPSVSEEISVVPGDTVELMIPPV